MTMRDSIRIELTTEQQQQIRDAFGAELSSLELDARELEQRIAPITITKIADSASPGFFKN